MTDEQKAIPMLHTASTSEDMRSLLTFAREQGPAQSDLDRLTKRLSPLVGVSVADLSGPMTDLTTAPANPPGFSPAVATAGKGALVKVGLSGLTKAIVAASIVTAGAVWWAYPSAPIRAPQREVVKVATPLRQPTPTVQDVLPVVPTIEREAPIPAAPAERPARLARPRPVEPKLVPAPLEEPSEMDLIRRAESLRAQPEQALRALHDHARLYPAGMLAQEREVLAIEALLASGQRAEAEARATSLAASHPGSAHLRRVRVLLEAGPAE